MGCYGDNGTWLIDSGEYLYMNFFDATGVISIIMGIKSGKI